MDENVSHLDTRGLESSQTGLHLTPDTLLTEILLVPWVDLVVYEPPLLAPAGHLSQQGLGLAAAVHQGRVQVAEARVKVEEGLSHFTRHAAGAGTSAKLHCPEDSTRP